MATKAIKPPKSKGFEVCNHFWRLEEYGALKVPTGKERGLPPSKQDRNMRRCLVLLCLGLPLLGFSQNDEAYGKKIREYTTESFFLPDTVDHLPASNSVPSPDKFLGHYCWRPKRF